MRKKKITDTQFTLDCINKEFEIANTCIKFETFEELKNYTHEHETWYNDFEITMEQHNEWKQYFLTHFYDWKPKYYSKKDAQREFAWFDLCFGFTVKTDKV